MTVQMTVSIPERYYVPMDCPKFVSHRHRHGLSHASVRTTFVIIHTIRMLTPSLSSTRSPCAHPAEPCKIHHRLHSRHITPSPSTPRATNLSTLLASRHRVRPVRITLPRDRARGGHDRKLVRERRPSRQLDRLLPHRVARCVPSSRQARSTLSVPVAQLRDAADDLDGLSVVGGALLGKGHGDFGGAVGRRGCARCCCPGGSGCRGFGSCRRRGCCARAFDGDVGAAEVDLRRLPGVPLEGEQGVLGDVVGDLDLLGYGVAACDGGLARSKGSSIDTLASSTRVCLEGIAGEPVSSLTSRVLAVRVDATVLAGNIGAVERAGFEAFFSGLLLGLSRNVARRNQFVDELLVLADAVGEHASVVAIIVDTPFPG